MQVQDWPSTGHWAERNGYGAATAYSERELKSIAPRLAGLYLLEFGNGQAYIGISIDIKSRLKQHSATHADIEAFRIRPLDTSSIELRRVERALVHSAEAAGITLRNREHAAVIFGETGLDSIVTPAEQKLWLDDPSSVNRTDDGVGVTYTASQLAAHERSFAKLEDHPRYSEILAALGAYLDACVPFPVRTEGTFWTVSCYPGSSKTLILRVSMGMLETFYIWSNPDSGDLEVRFFVDGRCLPAPKLISRLKIWRKLSKHGKAGPIAHKSAGAFERTVLVEDIAHLEEVLSVPGVAQSAAHHALAVMRKRQSGYKISHCPQLATAGTSALGLEEPHPLRAETPVGSDAVESVDDVAVSDTSNARVDIDEDKDAKKLGAFVQADATGEVRRHLADLIDAALPYGREDVAVHWGLTCMPATSAGKGRKRLYTLNVGQIEVAYVVSSTRPEEARLAGYMVMSASELEVLTGASIDGLRRRYPALTFQQVGYSAAKGDDVTVGWSFDSESLDELDQLPWKDASAVLADTLRTSKCPYVKFHSPALLAETSVIQRTDSIG